MEKTVDKPALKTLREMEVGDSATFPIERTSYISSVCVRFGLQWGKKFKTSTNRETRTITVTRAS